MATAGSSYLSKSKKDFKPKAPVRRSGAPGSSHTSVRGSVERHVQSQTQTPTPQPPASRPNVVDTSAAPAPVQITTSPSLSKQPATFAPIASQTVENAISIPIPSREYQTTPTSISVPTLTHPPSPRPGTGQPPPATQAQALDAAVTVGAKGPQIAAISPSQTQTTISLGSDSHSAQPQGSIVQLDASPSHSVSRDNSASHEDAQSLLPAAKRRRIHSPRPVQSTAEDVDPNAHTNATIPTVEVEQNGAQVIPIVSAEADPTQLSRMGSKGKPAKSKGKRRAEDMAAAIVADATQSPTPKRKAPKKNTKGKQHAEDSAAEVVTDATRGRTGQAKEGTRRGRKRVATPENAETIEIAPSLVKMSDLCKDIRIGQKSSREMELQELDWTEVIRKQREKKHRIENHETPPPETVDQMLERVTREREQQQSAQAFPDTHIINGQIVIDESSLRIDRHANAEAAREAEQQDVIDENQLTRRINSASWMKREKTESWNEELTDKFYDGLRMFGTDFQMISALFPGRNRRQIKLKFVREERANEERIKRTLLGERISVNMEEFSKLTNTVFMDPKDLARDIAEDKKRLEDEQNREKAAKEEILRQRAAEAAAEGAAVGEDSSAKENEVVGLETTGMTKKGGKRSKKPGTKPFKKATRGNMGNGGGQVEVLTTIEEA